MMDIIRIILGSNAGIALAIGGILAVFLLGWLVFGVLGVGRTRNHG